MDAGRAFDHRGIAVNRRAFSLIEIVLAVGLLSVLAMAVVSWTVSVVRVRAEQAEAVALLQEAAGFERLMRIDLLNHDSAVTASARREDRIWLADGRVHILTRDRGPAEVVYEMRDGMLVRSVRLLGSDGAARPAVLSETLVLGEATIELGIGDAFGVMRVELRGPGDSGGVVRRSRFEIPAGWVR